MRASGTRPCLGVLVMALAAAVGGCSSPGVGTATSAAEVTTDSVVTPSTAATAGVEAEANTTTTTAPSTTTTAAPTTTTTAPREFTMAFTGDVLIHKRVWELAGSHAAGTGRLYDFGPMLEPLRPFVEGVDWAVCHLEVPLSPDGTGLSSYPSFRAPGDVASDLRDVGYDACSTASNHSLDAGPEGLVETLDVLEAAGVRWTGTARTEQERWDSRWYQVGGARVAHLSYSYGFNGLRPPQDAPWMVGTIDEEQVLADAARARAEGAELVILSLHWGEEYVHEPNEQQRELGRRLLASPDVDLIIGHHAHVVQPIEHIDGEWLVYGLGNLLHNMTQPVRRDQLLVQVQVVDDPAGSLQIDQVSVVPLFVDQATLEVLPAGPALRPADVGPGLAAELDASWERTLAVLQQGSGWPELAVHG